MTCCYIRIRFVTDPPGAPTDLQVLDYNADYVTVAWKPPTSDGGAEITQFIIEKKDVTRVTGKNDVIRVTAMNDVIRVAADTNYVTILTNVKMGWNLSDIQVTCALPSYELFCVRIVDSGRNSECD